jgi:hypothetical protein
MKMSLGWFCVVVWGVVCLLLAVGILVVTVLA